MLFSFFVMRHGDRYFSFCFTCGLEKSRRSEEQQVSFISCLIYIKPSAWFSIIHQNRLIDLKFNIKMGKLLRFFLNLYSLDKNQLKSNPNYKTNTLNIYTKGSSK